MTSFRDLLVTLSEAGVEYIVVGGVAGAVYGAARVTYDLDVVYRRTPENFTRVVSALSPLNPRLRGADKDIPFIFDERTLRSGLNFTLTTDLGDLDLIGEITAGGSYEDLQRHSVTEALFNHMIRVVTLAKLIELKRAAGRRKDLEAIAELELIRDRGAGPSTEA